MITDIRCLQCGAPAQFDIIRQQYLCSYCGGSVAISAAKEQAQGFRKMRAGHLRKSAASFSLEKASCSGCGASVVFAENEPLSSCAFCGRKLVREAWLHTEDLPESVIPFRISKEEAANALSAWCAANKSKPEARHLLPLLKELSAFYLPYELVRGPVHMKVSRMDGGASYPCESFLENEFINRSAQLDNLLLDAMEPFDLQGLTEFDFAYVAGHRVKIPDVDTKQLEQRVREEVAATCAPVVRKTLETKAVDVSADVSAAIRLPVLLPVCYISKGNIMAAVNGQTGKVSVRAEKDSHYIFLPWWLKALLATLLASGTAFLAMVFFGMAAMESLMISGMLALVLLVVTLCLFSETVRNPFLVTAGRKIYTSGSKRSRPGTKLIRDESLLSGKLAAPVFLRQINGTLQPVTLRFTTPGRVFRLLSLSVAVLFLPVIIALFLNGFNFSQIELGGSAVWFCIAVPVIPVYLLQFGIVELYENPLVYVRTQDGKRKRIKEKSTFKIDKQMIPIILHALFIPPMSLAVWFAILCFIVMCYLTAFGF